MYPGWCVSGLNASLWTKGSLVQFPIRAYVWVVGQVPSRGCMRGNHTLMFLSLLSPSLPLSLEMNKQNLKKKKNPSACLENARKILFFVFNFFHCISLDHHGYSCLYYTYGDFISYKLLVKVSYWVLKYGYIYKYTYIYLALQNIFIIISWL